MIAILFILKLARKPSLLEKEKRNILYIKYYKNVLGI